MMYSVYDSFGSPSHGAFQVRDAAFLGLVAIPMGGFLSASPSNLIDGPGAGCSRSTKKKMEACMQISGSRAGGFMLNHFTVPLGIHHSIDCPLEKAPCIVLEVSSAIAGTNRPIERSSFPLIQHQTVFCPVMAQTHHHPLPHPRSTPHFLGSRLI